MVRNLLFASSLAAFLIGANSYAGRADSEVAVRALVAEMSTVWNRGDMEGYLDLYAHNEKTTIVFADVITRGWDQIHALYTGNWSTEEEMGDFTTENVSVTFVHDDLALVDGIFRHQFSEDLVVGAFSLVVQPSEEGDWKILYEHTSRGRTSQ